MSPDNLLGFCADAFDVYWCDLCLDSTKWTVRTPKFGMQSLGSHLILSLSKIAEIVKSHYFIHYNVDIVNSGSLEIMNYNIAYDSHKIQYYQYSLKLNPST